MEIIPKSRKGIMLTLATVVLFVLMLAELVTYVSLNINYNTIVSSSSAVTGSATAVATLNSAVPVFLHQSLQSALNTLIQFESTPSLRKNYFINNTAYALQSLMYNGTIANALGAAQFTGNYQYISLPSMPRLLSLSNNGFTMTYWARLDLAPPGAGGYAFQLYQSRVGGWWFDTIIRNPDSYSWEVDDGTNYFGMISTFQPQIGTWYFYTLVLNKSTSQIQTFINGVLIPSGTESSAGLGSLSSTAADYIDCPGVINGCSFDGAMANVQIYNTALSANQIVTLYAKGMNAPPIAPSNIIGWWPLNGDANDNSGNGNNGAPTSVAFSNIARYTNPAMLNSTFSSFINQMSNQISN
jgi:Concanavalin A-like lectin/glucanases superfamily